MMKLYNGLRESAGAVFISFFALGCGPDIRIKECQPNEGLVDVARAVDLVYDHRDDLFSRMGFLSGAEDEMRDKWEKIKVTCQAPKDCSDSTALANANGWGNDVFVCYQNVRRLGNLCDLAAVLVHEKAHTDKVPPWPGHSHLNPPPALVLGDPLYRAQTITKLACEEDWGLTDAEKQLSPP